MDLIHSKITKYVKHSAFYYFSKKLQKHEKKHLKKKKKKSKNRGVKSQKKQKKQTRSEWHHIMMPHYNTTILLWITITTSIDILLLLCNCDRHTYRPKLKTLHYTCFIKAVEVHCFNFYNTVALYKWHAWHVHRW